MPSSEADLLRDVQEQAVEALMDFAPILIAQTTGPGGALDDATLDRNQRIARFVDYAQSGTLDFLPMIGRTDLLNRLVREFRADMAATLGRAP